MAPFTISTALRRERSARRRRPFPPAVLTPFGLTAICAIWLLAADVRPAAAAQYSAERFDSRIEVLADGSLRVIETVVFRFENKTFKHVFREIGTRRTDGIEIVGAAMDGTPFTRGDGPGQFEVKGDSRVRVTWRFAPVTRSTHTFQLTYVARGVVFERDGRAMMAWRALPSSHEYRIGSATVEIDLPAPPAAEVSVGRRRVADVSTIGEDTLLRVTASDIRSNGWIEVAVPLPVDRVAAVPRWRQHELAVAARRPAWLAAAGVLLLGGIVLLVALRQGYERTPTEPREPVVTAPPDTFPPAIAGALMANGSPQLEHAMATLFALADRGVVTITEEPKSFGQRAFAVAPRSTKHALSGHEELLLDLVTGDGGRSDKVPLSKARSRVASGLRRFSKAVKAEMLAAGLIDTDRRAIRNRYAAAGATFLILAFVTAAAGAVFIQRFGPWHMLVAAAFAIIGVVSFIFYGALTSLSNDGVRRAAQWRGFRRHLKNIARDRAQAGSLDTGRMLPFAVAGGMAYAWSKYLKTQRRDIPAWFQALSSADGGGAFAAMVASGGASGGGAGAGGAAGGGGSGAG